MPRLKTYDLFISHAWRYNRDYYRLVDMLGSASYFRWRNYSVPEHDPVLDPNSSHGRVTLDRALDRQVRPANCVLILSGMYAAHSYWIKREVKLAQRYQKPILALRPRGAQRLPSVVTAAALEVVGWRTSSIVDAIRRNSL